MGVIYEMTGKNQFVLENIHVRSIAFTPIYPYFSISLIFKLFFFCLLSKDIFGETM